MPQANKMLECPKEKGYKEKKKNNKRRRLENEMHIRCPKKFW
jgi:hypothetical protein